MLLGEGNSGYDIDAFESNTAVAKALYTSTLDAEGEATIPVTLLQTNSESGINHFIAALIDDDGNTSKTSNSLTVIVIDGPPDNLPDENTNLALLEEAVLSGSVDGGRGDLNHILYDPSKDDYFVATSWNEYGVNFGENLGTPGADDGFEWRVDWPTSKAINYVTFGGTYVNQPQPNSLWRISYLTGGVWVTLEEGQGGWIDSGIYEWDNTSGTPITADALRVQVYSDGTNDLVSIHLRGRGGVSIRTNDSATATKATLIQYLPQEISNEAANILPSIEESTPNNLNLYPNPATDNVVMSFDIPAKVVEFRVFDLLGRLVRVHKVDTSNNQYELPVFDLQAGTYFIRTVDEKGNEFQKQMVIKR